MYIRDGFSVRKYFDVPTFSNKWLVERYGQTVKKSFPTYQLAQDYVLSITAPAPVIDIKTRKRIG